MFCCSNHENRRPFDQMCWQDDKNISAKSELHHIRHRQHTKLNTKQAPRKSNEATENVLKPFYGLAETVKLSTPPFYVPTREGATSFANTPLPAPILYPCQFG